ncbi:MAG: LamG-like jellyroll fold domain-containing protein [Micavibrio sp.]
MKQKRARGGTGFLACITLFAGLLLLSPVMTRPALAACVAPVGAAGEIVYNVDEKVFQYCNDVSWIAMHAPGAGSGGCASPAEAEGRIVYSPTHRMIQGCAGTAWKAIGKPPSSSNEADLEHTFAGTNNTGHFGRAVGVDGNLAVVTHSREDVGAVAQAGVVEIYNMTTGALTATFENPAPFLNDRMGRTGVDISGTTGVVGAYQDDPGGIVDAGEAYVFNATTGALISTLNNPNPAAADQFGLAVSISGNLAVVGADLANPGAINDAGEAYIFNATTGALLFTLGSPTPTTSDYFGKGVAIDGNLVVVGEPSGAANVGRAYVFDATTGALVATLLNPDPVAGDNFGESVAIEGNVAIVGAWGDSPGGITDSGTAYAFNATTGALISTLANPDPTADDEFSRSQINLSNGFVVIGSHLDDPGGADFGRAYIFDVATGAILATLDNPAPDAVDSFGQTVAISGNIVVVGAYQDNPGGVPDAGSVYVFTLPGIGSCAAPVNAAGTIVFNSAEQVLQYCNGIDWVAVGKAPTEIVTSGLIGYWKFDEASGITAADSSGNGNAGTLTNMDGGTDWVAGHVGNGLDFDGVDDFVNAGSAAILDNLAAKTACHWVYPRPRTGYNVILYKYQAGGVIGWDVYQNGASSSHGGVGFQENFSLSTDNVWQHYCVTDDGATIAVYKNGVLYDPPDSGGAYGSAGSDASVNLLIGNNADSSHPFEGVLDEVRIYNRVLTLTEIQQLAAQ